MIDGTYVQLLPEKHLLCGDFDPLIKIMVGHNSNEGRLFTPVNLTETAFSTHFAQILDTTVNSPVISYILETLYPADFSGKYGYTTPLDRASLSLGDYLINCRANYLGRANRIRAYAYYFDVKPGSILKTRSISSTTAGPTSFAARSTPLLSKCYRATLLGL